jgi:hypothetical protein
MLRASRRVWNVAQYQGTSSDVHRRATHDDYESRKGAMSNPVSQDAEIQISGGALPCPKHMPSIDREMLLEALTDFAAELRETPTRTQMNDVGPYSQTLYYREFGSWNAVLGAAGLSTNHENEIMDARLIVELMRVAEEVERLPRFEDMEAVGQFSGQT